MDLVTMSVTRHFGHSLVRLTAIERRDSPEGDCSTRTEYVGSFSPKHIHVKPVGLLYVTIELQVEDSGTYRHGRSNQIHALSIDAGN